MKTQPTLPEPVTLLMNNEVASILHRIKSEMLLEIQQWLEQILKERDGNDSRLPKIGEMNKKRFLIASQKLIRELSTQQQVKVGEQVTERKALRNYEADPYQLANLAVQFASLNGSKQPELFLYQAERLLSAAKEHVARPSYSRGVLGECNYDPLLAGLEMAGHSFEEVCSKRLIPKIGEEKRLKQVIKKVLPTHDAKKFLEHRYLSPAAIRFINRERAKRPSEWVVTKENGFFTISNRGNEWRIQFKADKMAALAGDPEAWNTGVSQAMRETFPLLGTVRK